MSLQHKIDFAVIFSVNHANPNGDPLNGNRPRIDYDGFGEVTDVCLKRKIRDRLSEAGHAIFVQSDDRKVDTMPSLQKRAESDEFGLGKEAFNPKKMEGDETARKACKKWLDVRAFGQLFAFGKGDSKGVSIPIRGPVSLQSAFSIEPISITSTQITKSVSGEGDGSKRSSDTMGMKHRVDQGLYVFYGSMNPQLSEKTGFNEADAEAIKTILPQLFENDASSARPEGSLAVEKVFWWQHNCKSGQYSSAKVHRSLTPKTEAPFFELTELPGLVPEIIEGF